MPARAALRAASLALLGAALFLAEFPLRAYTFVQAGVDSNFLVDGDRVLFAQPDGSLTVLSAASGEVLAREKNRNYSGTLALTPRGLLIFNDQTLALLNPTNFTVLWEIPARMAPDIVDDVLVLQDGEGRVDCRDLATGRLRWTRSLPIPLQVVAEPAGVLVHHNPGVDENAMPVTALLDLEHGKELFRRTPPAGTNWASVYFTGTNLYVEAGMFRRKLSDYDPTRLVRLNLQGEEIGAIPIPSALQDSVRNGDLFELDGMTFWNGRIYGARSEIPFEKLGTLRTSANQTNASKVVESEYDFGPGQALTERARLISGTNSTGNAYAMEIEWRSPTNHWIGVLPYLMDRGRIAALGHAGGRILLGTDLGQVECIDAATGESLWLYRFPTLRRTISSSSQGMPPTLVEAEAAFRSDNAHPATAGLQVIGGKSGKPRLTSDPAPVDPYAGLGKKIAIAWAAAAVPFAFLVALHLLPRTRRMEPAILGSIAAWTTFLVLCGFLFFGRVSGPSSVALIVTLVTGMALGALNAVRCYHREEWGEAAIIMTVFVAVGLFLVLSLV